VETSNTEIKCLCVRVIGFFNNKNYSFGKQMRNTLKFLKYGGAGRRRSVGPIV
jgi:hypothetical protein